MSKDNAHCSYERLPERSRRRVIASAAKQSLPEKEIASLLTVPRNDIIPHTSPTASEKTSSRPDFMTRLRYGWTTLTAVCVWVLIFSSPATAQLAAYNQGASYSKPASENPFANIGLDQRLDTQIPLDLSFRDETGSTVQLGDYFGQKPVILSFAYYECPMLCTLVINGLIRTLRTLSFSAGTEFNIVTVSFNPKDTPAMAAAKRQTSLQSYSRKGAENGWHFLTGDAATVEQLTQAVGFRYAYDEKTQQYQHPSGIMILTPDGKLSRYFYGVEYAPRDVRLGLVEASAGKIGSSVDQVLLLCFHYDPTTGKYGLIITRALQLGGLVTVLALGGFMLISARRDRRDKITGNTVTVLSPRKRHT